MHAVIPRSAPAPATQAKLERAYYELCTSLTSLRTNLVLLDQGQARTGADEERIRREVNDALERLRALSRDLKVWHDREKARRMAHEAAACEP